MYSSAFTPITNRRNSNHSPQKIGTLNISHTRTPTRNDLSPRKTLNPYTVHHEQKLKVYIKFKPPGSNSHSHPIAYLNEKELQIERQSTNNKTVYTYDYVFHESCSSDKVFMEGCSDIIDQMFTQGQNGLIFVYGHTGTGKTYTMGLVDTIDNKSKGIVPQALKYIFAQKQRVQKTLKQKFPISLSFNQIYLDEVYDMLDFQSDNKLQIRQTATKEPYVENNISILVNNIQQAYQLLNIGLEKRRVGEQRINKRSSRGHVLITLSVMGVNGKLCRLCFVDLAGSERIKESESMGRGLKEAVYINSSLSALQALLMNIQEQSVRMYRGNKLTRLLQPFLQSGKIRLFVTSNYQNTQPIQFAKRCKGIKFMQKQIIETPPPVQKSPVVAKQQTTQQCTKSPHKHTNLAMQVQKLQKQNKQLTQSLTNSLVILSKINKLVFNVVNEQNIRSSFSLSDDYNLAMLDSKVEDKINQKINQLQQFQQEVIEKCSKLPNSLDMSTPNPKQKDDSVNTSVSNNPKGAIIGSELQNLINCLPNNSEKLHNRLNQIGFSVFQAIKNLSSLCQYRNVYKKQMFTYAIKEELLENKNKQLQTAINNMLKHIKSNQNLSSLNKITKQLKQMGIEISSISKSSKPRLSNQPSLKSRPSEHSTSPISRSTPVYPPQTQQLHQMPSFSSKPQKRTQQFLDNDEECGELFSNNTTIPYDRNQNRNSFNKVLDQFEKDKEKGEKTKGIDKGRVETAKSKNGGEGLGRSGRKLGGLILIQDL